jgi:hypothetical protein
VPSLALHIRRRARLFTPGWRSHRVIESNRSWGFQPASGFEDRGAGFREHPPASAYARSLTSAVRDRSPSSAGLAVMLAVSGLQSPDLFEPKVSPGGPSADQPRLERTPPPRRVEVCVGTPSQIGRTGSLGLGASRWGFSIKVGGHTGSRDRGKAESHLPVRHSSPEIIAGTWGGVACRPHPDKPLSGPAHEFQRGQIP